MAANSQSIRVLVVEDRTSDAGLMIRELERAGFAPQWRRVETEAEFVAELENHPDLILSDYSLPQFDGLRALEVLRARELDIPFILVSGTLGEEAAVAVMRQGATDYLLKDRTARLGSSVTRALAEKRLRDERRQFEQTLRRSQSHLTALINSVEGIVWEADAESLQFTFVSPQAERMLGYPLDRWINEPHFWVEHIHPDDHEQTVRRHRECVRQRRDHELEYRMLSAEGRAVWLKDLVTVVPGDGHVVQLRGIKVDISEQKRAARQMAALATLGRRLNDVTEPEDAARVIVETAEDLLGWDACMLELYDAATDRCRPVMNVDLIEGRRQDVAPAYAEEPPSARVRQTIAEGPQLILRQEPALVPGELAPFGDTSRPSASILLVPVRHRGEVIAVLSIQSYTVNAYRHEDLAALEALADHCGGALAQIRAREARRESEERFRELAETIQEAFWMVDPETDRVLYISPAYEAIWGRSCQSLYESPQSWLDAIHPGDRARIVELWRRLDLKGFDQEYRVVRPDGQIRWVRDRGFPVRNAAGSVERWVGVAGDVTQHKELEAEVALRERQLSSFFAGASTGLAILDRDLRFLLVNDPLAVMNGQTVADHVGKTVAEIVPKLASRILPLLKSVLDTGRPVINQEVSGSPREGSEETRHFVVSYFPIEGPDRQIDHLGAVIVEITDQKRIEQALARRVRLAALGAEVGFGLTQKKTLRESLQHCALALVTELDALFARIWTLNEAEDVLELQASAGRYTHLEGRHARIPAGQWKIGKIARERKPLVTNSIAGDLEVSDQEWAKREGIVAFAGYPLLVEERLVGVIAMFAQQSLPAETLDALASIADSIALGIERKRAETALIENQKRIELLLQSTSEGICGVDLEGRCTFINHAGAAMFGFSPEEVVGSSMHELVHHHRPDGSPYPRSECPIVRAVKRSQGCQVSTEHFWRRDGSSFPVDYTSSPIVEGGAIHGMVVTFSDITVRQQLEEQLRQSQKMEAIGQLAGGVAHDFNNILATIMMQADLTILVNGLPQEARDGLEEIRTAAERAANLTRRLLLFSRRQVMQPRHLDLNEAVTSLAKMLQRIIGEDVRLQLHLCPTPLFAHADAGMLDQVLMNLAVNARDAMPEGGRLIIETSAIMLGEDAALLHPDASPGRYITLTVQDTGCGIPPETQRRIFEPFFTTKEPGRGTGLGLATVFGIVKQHQGWLEVESAVNRGTSFHIYLPAVATAPDTSVAAPRAKPRGGTETILLVEDEPSVRLLIQALLERQGYRVLEAANGNEAVKLWKEQQGVVALVLTDLIMPGGVSGQQLARRFQDDKPQLKVMFTSGYSPEMAGGELRLRPGENFLQKPFIPDQLLDAIRRSLDS